VAALSQVLTAEKKSPSRDGSPSGSADNSPSADAKSENAPSEGDGEAKDLEEVTTISESNGDDSEPKDDNGGESTGSTFSYDQLKAKSENPVTGIDFKRREAYLSAEEFETIFGMTKEAFYKLPRWKQDLQKKKVDLF
jgi:hypothetical protein